MLIIAISDTGEQQGKTFQRDTKDKRLGRGAGAMLRRLIDSRMFNGHLNLNSVLG